MLNKNQTEIELLKIQTDDLQVEYELVSEPDSFSKELSEMDSNLEKMIQDLTALDRGIEKLVSHADGLDYTVAAASGILAGLVDSFFVGKIEWAEELKKTQKIFNNVVIKKAGLDTDEYSSLSDEEKLTKAIRKLEQKYPLPSDNVWKTPGDGNSVSSPRLHHIDDLCHHPTPIGFIACLISVLFKTAIFVDKNGRWHFRWANTDKKDMLWLWGCIIATAFLHWVVALAEKKYSEKQYEEMPKPLRGLLRVVASAPAAIQVLMVFNNWLGHLCSDMAGSSSTPGGGAGIPGLLLSSLKELCAMPPLNMIPGLHKLLDSLFLKGFDARAEVTVLRLAGKQALPVLLNEVIVRGFYFVRRLANEAKQHGKAWQEYDWENTLPFGNRTIKRMLTISCGTFVAADLADAAIRSGLEHGFNVENPLFWADFALRINFVGVGRFTIAVFSDLKMGFEVSKRLKERDEVVNRDLIILEQYDVRLTFIQKALYERIERLDKEANDKQIYERFKKWKENKNDR